MIVGAWAADFGQGELDLLRAAVDLLVRQIRGETLSPADRKIKLPCRLVVRRSCGP